MPRNSVPGIPSYLLLAGLLLAGADFFFGVFFAADADFVASVTALARGL